MAVFTMMIGINQRQQQRSKIKFSGRKGHRQFRHSNAMSQFWVALTGYRSSAKPAHEPKEDEDHQASGLSSFHRRMGRSLDF